MSAYIVKTEVKRATLIIDPKDDECQQVQQHMERTGIDYITREIGEKAFGASSRIAFAGPGDQYAKFSTIMVPPILVVEHGPTEQHLNLAVLVGKFQIEETTFSWFR